jgi:hypothetical protein
MVFYIEEAVRCWSGSNDPKDPLFAAFGGGMIAVVNRSNGGLVMTVSYDTGEVFLRVPIPLGKGRV